MDLFVHLAENATELCTREQLLEAVWPDHVAPDELLTGAISDLRRALRDSPADPQHIETVPKRGYRLIGRVNPLDSKPAPERQYLIAGIVVFASLVTLALLSVGGFRERSVDFATGAATTSIAVLPLENVSGDLDEQYFADGMTDTLIGELSKIGALRVISRESVMRFKDGELAVSDIARRLNVQAVVVGSALHVEDTVRIDVQLKAADGSTELWTDSFDGVMSDVLALHGDVARAVAREIRVRLTAEEASRLSAVRSVDPEAFRRVLVAQHHMSRWVPAEVRKARRHLQHAIALDPQFALAYTRLARSYSIEAFMGHVSPKEVYGNVKAAVARALTIDAESAEAHHQNAATKYYFDWNWNEAEAEFRKAIALNPSYAHPLQTYAWLLTATGRTDEAHARIEQALMLDPLAMTLHIAASDIYYFSGEYAQAVARLQQAFELGPNNGILLSRLGWSYVQMGRFDEAVETLKLAWEKMPTHTENRWMLGHAYAVAGQHSEARSILDDLAVLSQQEYVMPFAFAVIHAGLGEHDLAIDWLERAYEDRNGWMVYLNVAPHFDPLRSHPRFEELVRRMRFPDWRGLP